MKTQTSAIQKPIEQILISVIIPVYNVESYIEDCLYSVINQTHTNLEIIIVEDCSTDDSKIKLIPYLRDERIHYIEHKRNAGLSAARNTGIDAATGDYIMFVDSDDMIHYELVSRCVKAAQQWHSDIITYQFTTIEEGDDLQQLQQQIDLTDLNLAAPATSNYHDYFTLPHFAWLKFIKTNLIKTHAIQFPVDLYYEDWPFHWQAGLLAQKIHHLPIKAYFYRQRASSITGSTGNKLLDLFKIQRLVMDLLEPYQQPALKRILANKIKQSHWTILTRIDSQYLTSAFKKAKQEDALLVKHNYTFNNQMINILITALTRSPTRLAMTNLITIRKSLKIRRQITNNFYNHSLSPLSSLRSSLRKNKFRKQNVTL